MKLFNDVYTTACEFRSHSEVAINLLEKADEELKYGNKDEAVKLIFEAVCELRMIKELDIKL